MAEMEWYEKTIVGVLIVAAVAWGIMGATHLFAGHSFSLVNWLLDNISTKVSDFALMGIGALGLISAAIFPWN